MTAMTPEDLHRERSIARDNLTAAIRGAVYALTDNERLTMAEDLLRVVGLSNSAPGRQLANAVAAWQNVTAAIAIAQLGGNSCG
jgi:hypothetical protein